MHIKKEESEKKDLSKESAVWEYPIPSEQVSFATALMHGRYPASGTVFNMKCEQVYYVLSGSGIIHSEEGDFSIEEGDLYYFKKEEKYWIEGEQLKIALINSPAWKREQYAGC